MVLSRNVIGGCGGGGGYTEGARVYHNANQLIAVGVVTQLAMNQERYDTDDIHDTVTNNSRLTCKTEGKYVISGSITWAANPNGLRDVFLTLNGATYITAQLQPTASSGTTPQSISTVYDLAISDYVELSVYHYGTGGALNVLVAGNYSPELSMQRIG